MNRLRIAVIGPVLSASGTCTHVRNSVAGLDLLLQERPLLITYQEPNASQDPPEDGRTFLFPKQMACDTLAEFANFIASVADEHEIDILHPQIKPFALFASVLATKLLRKQGKQLRIIGTWHSNFGWIVDATYHLALAKMAAEYLDAVIPVSPNVVSDLQQHLGMPSSRIAEIVPPGGIDIESIQRDRSQLLEQLKVTYRLDKPYVVFLGRQLYNKGVDLLLKGFKPLAGDYKLLLIGTGPFLEESKRLAAELSLNDDVLFTGFVEDEDVYALLQGASVYCLPSRWESFSISTLESMAAGLPIVVADVGGLRSWVGDNAYFIPPESHTAVTEALSAILGDEKLADFYRAKSKALAARYDWRELAKRTLANIKNACENPSSVNWDDDLHNFGQFRFEHDSGVIELQRDIDDFPKRMWITPYALFFPSEALENESRVEHTDPSTRYFLSE